MLAQPVPPFATGRMPVTSLARLMSAVVTAPATALRNPVTLENVNELDATSAEVDAVPVTAKFVVVAFVVVLFVTVRLPIVEGVVVPTTALEICANAVEVICWRGESVSNVVPSDETSTCM